MKKLALSLLATLPLFTWAQFEPVQIEEKYQVQVDLTNIVDDRVKVEVVVPILMEEEAIYQLPVMVPGTYKIYNFGQFVNDLVAINGFGDTLGVEVMNQNQWKIKNAQSLYKLIYWVDDSYDAQGVDIFAPGGTSIQEDVVLLNNFGYVGYLDGHKSLEYSFEVMKPAGFTGTTSLSKVSGSDSLDIYLAKDYFQLHDCPILYAKPDTASVVVGNTRISVGVYSPRGHLNAKEILDGIEPVFHAASDYLGGNLPADQYSVLVYGMTIQQISRGMGALEHHTSTVVNIPDIEDKFWNMISPDGGMIQMMRDIVSHEFFHIVTPLSIHSLEINDYDFMNPQMSKHLWLYEGITEYNSNISQVRSGVLTEEQFFKNMKDKMTSSHGFNENIPFTVSSQFALTYFESEYLNVYQKGALIGMCLDLTLRTETDGQYGLPQLLLDLSATYGKDTFFVDDNLFDIIEDVSGSTTVREFFARHVEGAEPLPFGDLLDYVGYTYEREKVSKQISTANMGFRFKDNNVIIAKYNRKDEFAQQMGFKRGDILVSLNGTKITEDNLIDVIAEYTENAEVGDAVTFEIKRKVKGKLKKMKLKGTAQISEYTQNDVLVKRENISESEAKMKKAWLNL